MLAYCKLDYWKQISVKFESEFYHFHSRNVFEYVVCNNGGHYVQGDELNRRKYTKPTHVKSTSLCSSLALRREINVWQARCHRQAGQTMTATRVTLHNPPPPPPHTKGLGNSDNLQQRSTLYNLFIILARSRAIFKMTLHKIIIWGYFRLYLAMPSCTVDIIGLKWNPLYVCFFRIVYIYRIVPNWLHEMHNCCVIAYHMSIC